MEEDKLLTYDEIAELAQVSKSQVSVWVTSGVLPAVHLGRKLVRIRQSAFMKFIEAHEKGGL